jgi:hypothetical protein
LDIQSVKNKIKFYEFCSFYFSVFNISLVFFSEFYYLSLFLIIISLYPIFWEHKVVKSEYIACFSFGFLLSEIYTNDYILHLPIKDMTDKISFFLCYLSALSLLILISYIISSKILNLINRKF